MTTETMAYAALIVGFAYFVYGLTGFGSGLVAVPLLAHFMPLKFIVPYVLILNVAATLTLLGGQGFRRNVNWRELAPLLPFGILGIGCGIFLLLNLPKAVLLPGLGVFVLLFGLRNLLGLRADNPVSRVWAIPAGLAGGVAGALFSAAGPPYVIYLTHRMQDKSQLRSSFSVVIMVESALRLLAFLAAGLALQEHMFDALLPALPLMALGLYAGSRLHVGVSQAQLLKLVGLLLTMSGLSLLVKAVHDY